MATAFSAVLLTAMHGRDERPVTNRIGRLNLAAKIKQWEAQPLWPSCIRALHNAPPIRADAPSRAMKIAAAGH